MGKEFIICTIIIIVIIIGNGITQKYTKDSIENINIKLQDLEETMKKEVETDNVEVEKNMNNEEVVVKSKEIEEKENEIYKEWDNMFSKLAYYIEHEELEKVSRILENIKSYVKLKQYDNAIKEINEVKFVLNHIEDKYSFNLQNIF